MEKYSVEFKNVNKKMGGVNRIDNLTLNLSKGKIYAIIGPNGSGKTTLMNLITGLYRPDEGKISVFEYNPISDYKEVRRLIGYVPQETSLYPEFSARDNLRLYAALYLSDLNDIEGKINELLKLVELTERADEPVKTYSGGMKRRLSIGRALLTDPKILLLDEPPLGVDVQGTHRIWEYIKELRNQNKTILVTTNVMSEAEFLGDEVIIIDKGVKLCQGSLDDLKNEHGKEIIVIKTEEVIKNEKLQEIFNEYSTGECDEILIYAKKESKDILEIIELIKPYSKIEGIEHRKPTLDDIFLAKTGRSLRN